MRLKIYRARDVATAIAQVRAELGVDALILGTRRVGDGVEVTAALEEGVAPVAAPPITPPDPAREAILTWHGHPRHLRGLCCTAACRRRCETGSDLPRCLCRWETRRSFWPVRQGAAKP